jgi:hypothetical protein
MWIRSRDEHRSATLADVFAAVGVEHTDEMLAAFHEWWEPHTLLDPDAQFSSRTAPSRPNSMARSPVSRTVWCSVSPTCWRSSAPGTESCQQAVRAVSAREGMLELC